jgi:2-polyprenyl-3-methyl-5-hydroxy-6-metoxy-1,4-benzoquinol methylase
VISASSKPTCLPISLPKSTIWCFPFGLIEHFNDTKFIIGEHLKFLKPGGTLFITLPNFKSVNGWVQRSFDKENYDKHNINSMDL